MKYSTKAQADVADAEGRAQASADRYRALCDRVTTWSAGKHRTAIARLLNTAYLWRCAADRARRVGDPRADDWEFSAACVAGLAELHELDLHLDQIGAELGGAA